MTVLVTFEDWTQGRTVSSWGTNAGANELPFQRWRHFKEAFAPELVARAISESQVSVTRCLDPFGGSGTTGLACQFLGIKPIIVEVNPFLAHLIEAKLASYNSDAIARDLGVVFRQSVSARVDPEKAFHHLPPTFVEPGADGRWIFDRPIATRITALLHAIGSLPDEKHQRLFRVLLGGVLIHVSNVVVNGKGRRYRGGWSRRPRSMQAVDWLFRDAVQRAIKDIHRYAQRACPTYELRQGDCRVALDDTDICELAVFSPPYPNSFDYTDVYNLELWMLGYLTDSHSNQVLRRSTLCSHVQLSREFPQAPKGSARLDNAIDQLVARRSRLWDNRIPEMVGGYFGDLLNVLGRLRASVTAGGSVWMVVGDSRYASIQVETAQIVAELAPNVGKATNVEPCRSMRASAQQGGRHELAETLIVFSLA